MSPPATNLARARAGHAAVHSAGGHLGTEALGIERSLVVRAEEHLAIISEVDVQHVVRFRYPRMARLELDGLPEHLHRSLPYILGLPLHPDHLVARTKQEHGRVVRVHLSFGELGLVELPVYGMDAHGPGTVRTRDARTLGHVPFRLYLLRGKPFELLTQLSDLLGRVHRLSSGALCQRDAR